MSHPRAHIVGVGESAYARWGKIGDVSEHALACQAIQRAVADAGLSMDDVDGLASFAEDRNEAIFLAAELGLPALRFGNMVWMPGGGGGCAAVSNAAMAVETGQAEVVVVYRSLCQGQFYRFGSGGVRAHHQGTCRSRCFEHNVHRNKQTLSVHNQTLSVYKYMFINKLVLTHP